MSRHGVYDPVDGFIPDDDSPEEQKPMTNADKIRAMTDEELSDFIGTHDCLDCPLNNEDSWCDSRGKTCHEIVLNWLKQEVTDA